MLDIKVKAKEVKFSIPIPYSILNLSISFLTSSLINRLSDRWIKKYSSHDHAFFIPPLDKKQLKAIIHELKQHKGTELVQVKAKDGTEIKIKL
jgi:hypothetical protein